MTGPECQQNCQQKAGYRAKVDVRVAPVEPISRIRVQQMVWDCGSIVSSPVIPVAARIIRIPVERVVRN
jgi:hypothetical protein